MKYTYLSYKETGYFSKLVTDYLCGAPELTPFYNYAPNEEGLDRAVAERTQYPVNRALLTETLRKQYEPLPQYDAVIKNIDLLSADNTFTVCTAHQPNLLTGYLYFIYKIVHAIKLAAHLSDKHPDKHFVPVYYMGSEDNDLDELGTFRYGGKKFVWDAAGQTGAVGRMRTDSLKPVLDEMYALLGPPGAACDELKDLLTKAYLNHDTIGKATQYLVNELFGRYGLIVLDPDEAAFKNAFIPVMEDDLFHHTAYSLTTSQIEKLEAHYKSQAHPRPINLFYLKDNVRERIERRDNEFHVVNTDIVFSEAEIKEELSNHPERFSPNVILRGAFQETILPNVAFIGGGAEVAYWLQLKTVFAHYKVFFPQILLRQSALWIEPHSAHRLAQLHLSVADIFREEHVLLREYMLKYSQADWQTGEEAKTMEDVLNGLRDKAASLDPTLRSSAEAVLTKIKYQLQVLEKKMLKAEKRKMHETVGKITKLRELLFPGGGLQERVENFAGYYVQYGSGFIDTLYEGTLPLGNKFLVVQNEA